MSKLLHVKGIILTHMTAEPELKEAVLDIINCIDLDLDNSGYDEDLCSDTTLDAIANLDLVLGAVDEAEQIEETEKEVVISREALFDNTDEENLDDATSTTEGT